MKKKIVLSLLVVISLFMITGCGNKENNNKENNQSNNGNSNQETKVADHKIYKYMKISTAVSSTLYYHANQLFDNPSEVGHSDDSYKPFLIVEFDTKTGVANKVTYYGFFLDNDDNMWVNKAIEAYETSSGEAKDEVTNVKKGRVNQFVSYLTANIDPKSYGFDQYLQMLFDGQDIEKYKDEVFFSRLYNYSTEPAHEEGDNYFEDSLTDIRIEWSDSEITGYPTNK